MRSSLEWSWSLLGVPSRLLVVDLECPEWCAAPRCDRQGDHGFLRHHDQIVNLCLAIKAVITVLLILPTFLGTRNISRLSVMICAIVLVAFPTCSIWAYAVATDYDDLYEIRRKTMIYNPALILTPPLVNIDCDGLLSMTNAFFTAVDLATIASAYHLRNKLPYIPHPAKVLGGKNVLLNIAILPTAIICYVTYDASANGITSLIILVFLILGSAYGYCQHQRHLNETIAW
ncbi:hypothetical protein FI667_g9935, partial [Globisporangium splendens]